MSGAFASGQNGVAESASQSLRSPRSAWDPALLLFSCEGSSMRADMSWASLPAMEGIGPVLRVQPPARRLDTPPPRSVLALGHREAHRAKAPSELQLDGPACLARGSACRPVTPTPFAKADRIDTAVTDHPVCDGSELLVFVVDSPGGGRGQG